MYEKHFGLRTMPFNATPDPSFYINLSGHHRALNTLLVALRGGEGIVKIVGEVGTGKSMLCRKLLKDLGPGFVAAYLPYSALSPYHIQLDLAEELGVVLPPNANPHQLLKYLKEVLLDIHSQGRKCVVIVDEAQALPDASLECIRLLSNLETRTAKLLQIVLVGQPELDIRIQQPCLRQLRQRIAFAHRLDSIDRGTTEAYIRCRLSIAGYSDAPLFTPWAINAIHRSSRGIPRIINTLCHKSMICAYGRGALTVRHLHVRRAAADSEGIRKWRSPTRRSWGRKLSLEHVLQNATPRIAP